MNSSLLSEYGLVPKQYQALEGIIRMAAMEDIGIDERFSETEVADHLGLSRTPVRQALAVLAFCGLAKAEPQVGTKIVPPEVSELRQLTHINVLNERQAVISLKKSRVGESEIEGAFQALGDSLREDTEDVDAFLRADTNFHRTFCEVAGNPIGAHVMSLWGLKRRIYRVTQPRLNPSQTQKLMDADGRIFTNIMNNVPGIGQAVVDDYYGVIRAVEL